MNTADQHLTDEELDERLRVTFATMMPLLDAPNAGSDRSRDARSASGSITVSGIDDRSDVDREVEFHPDVPASGTGRTPRVLLAAAAVLALVGGLAVAQNLGSESPVVGDQPETAPGSVEPGPPAQAQQTPDTTIDYEVAEPVSTVDPTCSGVAGCDPFAELPVAAGVSDFYVGPASLGTPVVAAPEDFDLLVRCSDLDDSGTTCAKIEGFAGFAVTTYPSDTGIDTATVDTSGGRSADAETIAIGTTFADITPAEYARQWGDPVQGGAEPQESMVGGHPAATFSGFDVDYVVWNERSGVLTWVEVPKDRGDELLTIAEGVRRVPGPATIPWIVTVPDPAIGSPYDAGSNDGATLLIGRQADGGECVGYGYIEGTCSGDIGEQTFVRYHDGGAQIVGVASADTAAVRLSQNGRVLAEVETRSIDAVDTTSRLFDGIVDVTGQVTVDWLDAADQVLATTTVEIDDDFCQNSCG